MSQILPLSCLILPIRAIFRTVPFATGYYERFRIT